MSVPCIIVFSLLFILQTVTSTVFLKIEIPKPSKKSLIMKAMCSTLFVITGIAAMLFAGNFSGYAWLVMSGLVISWIGDFILHSNTDEKHFIAGVLAFLSGHICYIVAFFKAQNLYFPDMPFLSSSEAVLLLGGVCFGQCRLHILRADYGKAFIPCTVYMNVIMLMFVKAISLGVRLIEQSPTENAVLTGIVLMVGVCMFDVSDFTLALLRFTDRYSTSYGMRKLNIWTYFYAQMCLGFTILNIAA